MATADLTKVMELVGAENLVLAGAFLSVDNELSLFRGRARRWSVQGDVGARWASVAALAEIKDAFKRGEVAVTVEERT